LKKVETFFGFSVHLFQKHKVEFTQNLKSNDGAAQLGLKLDRTLELDDAAGQPLASVPGFETLNITPLN